MQDNATGNASGAGDLQSTIDAFETLLSPPADKQEGEANPDEAAPQAEESGAEAEAEQSAEAEAQSGDEEPTDEKTEEQTFTVRIDGKDETLPLSEILAGYSRTADYTRKTQFLAKQRQQLEAEAAAARQERSEYADLLPKLRAALEAGMETEQELGELRQNDPTAYLLKRDEIEARRARIAAVQQEERRVAAAAAAEHEAQREQVLIEQRNQLLKALPEWKDAKVASKEAEDIRKVLLAAGFAEDEAQLYDHRAVLIARKAAMYDALMAKKPALTEKMKTAPVVKPGGGSPKKSVPHQASMDRLSKSGSVHDAAAVFANFL